MDPLALQWAWLKRPDCSPASNGCGPQLCFRQRFGPICIRRCREIGFSRHASTSVRSAHTLKAVKIGKRRLVERLEVERFLAAHRVG